MNTDANTLYKQIITEQAVTIDIKELIGGILFVGIFFFLIAATVIIEPLNQTIIETKGEIKWLTDGQKTKLLNGTVKHFQTLRLKRSY